MKRSIAPVVLGIFFILAGVGYLGSNFLNWDIFFYGWWTLFLIVPCVISVVVNKPRFFNVGGALIGTLLLLNCQGILTNHQTRVSVVAALILAIGVGLISRYLRSPRSVK